MREKVQSVFAMIKKLVSCFVLPVLVLPALVLATLVAGESAHAQQDDNSTNLRQEKLVPRQQKEWDIIAPAQPEWIGDNPLSQSRKAIGPAQPAYGVNPALEPLGAAADPGAADFSELTAEGAATVSQVIDPLRLRLQNGKIVQLAGLDIPDLDPYEPGETSLAVRDRLKALLENKQVRFYVTKNSRLGRSNRLGYQLVQLMRSEDGLWIQGALLDEGLARVRPSERNPEMAAQMIAREDKARAEGKGIWKDNAHPVLTPETAGKHLGQWAVVEGAVRSAATASNTLYLNFGADWRKDFTVSLSSDVRRAMMKDGMNPLNLGGTKVRVRGWLESYNGPHIKLLHPAWMEILPSSGNPAGGSGMSHKVTGSAGSADSAPATHMKQLR